MKRFFLATLLIYFGIVGPLSVFIILGVLYSLIYRGYELLFVGAVIDGYYGLSLWPIYTTVILFVVCGLELLKPYLLFYNN